MSADADVEEVHRDIRKYDFRPQWWESPITRQEGNGAMSYQERAVEVIGTHLAKAFFGVRWPSEPADVAARLLLQDMESAGLAVVAREQETEQEAFLRFHEMRERYGWTGFALGRLDVEEAMDRELTDEEWKKLSTSGRWQDISAVLLEGGGWELFEDVLALEFPLKKEVSAE